MFSRQVSRAIVRSSQKLKTRPHMQLYHQHSAAISVMSKRRFGVAAQKPIETTTENADTIRDYLKGLMEEKQQNEEVVLKPIDDDDLQASLENFQALFDEANGCLADCEVAEDSQSRNEEVKVATEAVDRAFAAYIDLLEDLRRADESQEEYYKDVREQNASRLKLLRRELEAILPLEN